MAKKKVTKKVTKKKITKKKATPVKKRAVTKKTTEKRAVGRPLEPVYCPEMCEALIDHMKIGLSFASFAGIAGVSRSTLYTFLDQHEEFAHAYEIAQSHCRLWWERLGLDIVCGARTNGTVYVLNMVNRFPQDWKLNRDNYEEKQAETQDSNLTINLTYNPDKRKKD